MLTAERTGMWRGRYRIALDGQQVAVWDPAWWRSGGRFEVQGRRYEVRAGGWGRKYRMSDEMGNEVALVERAGSKYWTARAGARTYEFRRASFWGTQQNLIENGVQVGLIRQVSAWSGGVEADLPGLALPVQIFVVGVQISVWQARRRAAAAS